MRTEDFSIEKVLSRLKGVIQTKSNSWKAICPGHKDNKPSLSITSDNGTLLLNCFAGCEYSQIIHALGLDNGNSKRKKQEVAWYDYKDANGAVVYQKIRYSDKTFHFYQPATDKWNIKGIDPVLYKLPELLRADPSTPVFIVEGEKGADAVTELGMIAVCGPFGGCKKKFTKKWPPTFKLFFNRRRVCILPDNDDVGRAYADGIAYNLAPVAAEVKVVALPNLAEAEDVYDWIQRGGNANQLLQLFENSPIFEPAVDKTVPIEGPADLKNTGPLEAAKAGQPWPGTDLDNAKRLVYYFGKMIRYCPPWGQWLIWDKTRWRRDEYRVS